MRFKQVNLAKVVEVVSAGKLGSKVVRLAKFCGDALTPLGCSEGLKGTCGDRDLVVAGSMRHMDVKLSKIGGARTTAPWVPIPVDSLVVKSPLAVDATVMIHS